MLVMTSLVSKVEVELLLAPLAAPLEKLVEHVLMVASGMLALSLSLNALFSVLIVGLSLFSVSEYLVGVGDLLKLALGSLRVVLVLVGVVPDGQLLKRLLYLLVGCTPPQAQQLVVVLPAEGQRKQQQEQGANNT
jgi:uncharacterized membrane protein